MMVPEIYLMKNYAQCIKQKEMKCELRKIFLIFKCKLYMSLAGEILTVYTGSSTNNSPSLFLFHFSKVYLFIFRERGREGGRDGEKHQHVVASCMPPTDDLACNPGMYPD